MVDSKTTIFALIILLSVLSACASQRDFSLGPDMATQESLELLTRGRSRLVQSRLQTVRVASPQDPWVAFALGRAYAQENLMVLARQEYQRALNLFPAMPAALIDLATLDYYQGLWQQSLQHLEGLSVPKSKIDFNRALVKFRQEEFSQAVALLDRALKLEPGWIVALELKALVHLSANDNQLAQDTLRQVLNLKENNLFALMNLIQLTHQNGEVEQADLLLETLSQFYPTFPSTLELVLAQLEEQFPWPPSQEFTFYDWRGKLWRPNNPELIFGDPACRFFNEN